MGNGLDLQSLSPLSMQVVNDPVLPNIDLGQGLSPITRIDMPKIKGASPLKSGALNGAISAVGGALGSAIGGGLSSGVGNALNAVGNIASNIPGPLGTFVDTGAKMAGGIVNALVGTSVDQKKLNEVNEGTLALNSFTCDVSSFDDIKGPQAQSAVQDAYKGGVFTKGSAEAKNAALRNDRNKAIAFADNTVANTVENIASTQDRTIFANSAAFGGIFDRINHRNMHRRNLRGFGGTLLSNGATWDAGISFIGNGGSHESNPYEGVPMGVDHQGTPNLVEEGEVVWNDYVFSKRLKVPKAFKEKYKLKGDNLTFADAAQAMSEESKERPNDPISKAGRDSMLSALMDQQEYVREKKAQREAAKEFNNMSPEEQLGIMQAAQQYAQGSQGASEVPEESEMNNNVPIENEGVPMMSAFGGKLRKNKFKGGGGLVNLRYVPALGAGIGVATDALGLTNKPDYSNAERVESAGKVTPQYIQAPLLGDYMTYRPLDTNFYLNPVRSSAAASRRAIANQSSGNRATAMAGILANDYNTNEAIGKAIRSGEEYNQAERLKVGEFNRATNQFNAQAQLDAAKANQNAYQHAYTTNLQGITRGAELRASEQQAANAARSANLTNFLGSLGQIGEEAYDRKYIDDLIKRGVLKDVKFSDVTTKAYGGLLVEPRKKGHRHA